MEWTWRNFVIQNSSWQRRKNTFTGVMCLLFTSVSIYRRVISFNLQPWVLPAEINSIQVRSSYFIHASKRYCICLLLYIYIDIDRSSPDDGQKSGRKYVRYMQLWKIHQSIPAEYDKSNTAIWMDQEGNMLTENVHYVQ